MTIWKLPNGTIFSEYNRDKEHTSFNCVIPPAIELVLKASSQTEMALWGNCFLKQTLDTESVKKILKNENYNQMMQNAKFFSKGKKIAKKKNCEKKKVVKKKFFF